MARVEKMAQLRRDRIGALMQSLVLQAVSTGPPFGVTPPRELGKKNVK